MNDVWITFGGLAIGLVALIYDAMTITKESGMAP